jgi:hypothetical protein
MSNFDDDYLLVRLPTNYMYGPGAVYGSNTTLTFPAFNVRDSSDNVNIITTTTITLNMATLGLNGLDTGTFAASSTYYIYAIGDSSNTNPSGVIASLSSVAPVLTSVIGSSNYVYRLYDWWIADGSVHFLKGYTEGANNTKRRVWDTNVSVLSAGTSTTLAAVDLSLAAPALNNMPVLLEVGYTPATANDAVAIAPGTSTNSTVATLPNISGVVATKVQTGQLRSLSQIVTLLPTIQYINSAAAGSTAIHVCEVEYSL